MFSIKNNKNLHTRENPGVAELHIILLSDWQAARTNFCIYDSGGILFIIDVMLMIYDLTNYLCATLHVSCVTQRGAIDWCHGML